MSATDVVKYHPSSVSHYIRQGWQLVPIPVGSKGPYTQGWNKPENCITSVNDLPQVETSIGLAHAYSGTMALDIDEWDYACDALNKVGINLPDLYNAIDAVVIDSGRKGHGKLLYKMPEGLILPSKKLIGNLFGAKFNYLDFRCATATGLTVQDVLPPSVHPNTGKPYKWAGHGSWQNLPEIPADLLTYWQSLLIEDSTRMIQDQSISTSWSEIQTALSFISPDVSRDEWVHIGMALHWAGYQDRSVEVAFQLWDEWSAQSELKYKGTKDLLNAWRSFQPGNGITIGTLFHYASEHGWTKPQPTAEELFSEINSKTESLIGPIDIMTDFKIPIPELNLSLWPDILATRAKEIGEQVGCDPLVPLFAGLSAVCGAVDSRIRLELMNGFQVPPVLWLMTIGAPADKKTPGSRPMMGVLKDIEYEDHPRYKKEMLEWEGREAAFASAKKAFLEFSASAENMLNSDGAPDVPDLPNPPVPLKITVSDITSQKLVRKAADIPRGLLCYLDEMNSWVKKMVDKSSSEDRSTWLVAYDAVRHEMDRVGSGSIHCENMAVSVYGNIQPKVFKRSVQLLEEDGLLQRFIPGILNTKKTKLGEPAPDFMTHREQWENTVRTCFAIPPQVYRLSDDAHTAFRQFQQWYEDTKQEEVLIKSIDTYMTAFGKLEGTAGRLILLFHMIESPFNPYVDKTTVKKVIRIIKEFIIPTFKYAYSEMAENDSGFESWLVDHIIYMSAEKSELTLSDIKRSARRRLGDANNWTKDQMVIEGMYNLEDAKWVIKTDEQLSKHSATWVINPELKNIFKDYRLKVIKAKQKQKDYIYRASKTGYRQFVKGYDPATMD